MPSRSLFLALAGLLLAGCGDPLLKNQAAEYDVGVLRRGEGTVVSSPAGIDCGARCVAAFSANTQVKLTAVSPYANAFAGWEGACTGMQPCVVTADAPRTVTAIFFNALVVTTSGPGTVGWSQAGRSCEAPCVGLYEEAAVVTLTANASSGAQFSGWEGACTGQGTCTVTMSEARAVKANFSLSAPVTHQLVVNVVGTGSGTVTSQPAGIACPTGCNLTLDAGAQVTLTAAADVNSEFLGWSGKCSGTALTCTLTMDESKSVTARFDLPAPCGWSRRFGGGYMDRANSLALGPSGRLLLSGSMWGQVDLGGGPVAAPSGALSLFVATYNPDASHRTSFARGASGQVMQGSQAVWADTGEVVVSGAFSGSVDLGDGVRTSNITTGGLFRGFLARYSVTGSTQWVRPLGATTVMGDGFGAVAVAPNGEVTVVGEFAEPETFGGPTTLTPQDFDLYIARYSGGGAFSWVKQVGGAGMERALGVDVSASTLVVTGSASEGSNFGAGAIPTGTYDQAFAVAYDAAGSPSWEKLSGTSTGMDIGRSVVIAPNGDVIVAGSFEGTVSFGGTALTSAGSNDAFVARYSSSGAFLGATRLGGAGYDEARELAVDLAGNLVVGGTFFGSANFGAGPVTSKGGGDIFLVKLAPTGDQVWAKTFGGTDNDQLDGLALDGRGNVLIAGGFQNSIDFGYGALSSAGYEDIFLACLPR